MNDALRQQLLTELVKSGLSPVKLERLEVLHNLLSRRGGNVNCFALLQAMIKGKLLTIQPQTLDDNVSYSATLLGMSKLQFIEVALRQPQLFSYSPQTLDSNTTRSAAALGLGKRQFVAAALKQPSLLIQRPETLESNAARSAELLQITKQQFVAAALRFPKLFQQNPDTVMAKIPYIKALAEAVGTPMDAATILLRIPVAIAYAKNHLHLRYVLARTGHTTSVSTAIVMPHAKAEAIVIKHYIDKARTLQVMYRKGLIKRLPEYMTSDDAVKCDLSDRSCLPSDFDKISDDGVASSNVEGDYRYG
jgi:hypothetical protein